MDKLNLIKNGNDVTVVDIATIHSKEQVVVGSYERDLILRTKGTIKIQVQNKFYDPLDNEVTNNIINDGIPTLFVTSIDNQIFPEQALVLNTSNGNLYYYFNSTLTPINEGNSITGNFISYSEQQNLSESQKKLALFNLGYVYETKEDVASPYNSQLVYSSNDSKHYYYNNNSWIESYLHLVDGGIVRGNTTFSANSNNTNATLAVYAQSYNGLDNINNYKGFFVGTSETAKGLGIYTDGNDSVISTTGENTLRIRINNFNNSSYTQPVLINNSGVGMGLDPVSSFNLSVNRSNLSEVLLNNKMTSSNDETLFRTYDYFRGFNLTNIQDDWLFAVDRLIVKEPFSTLSLKGVNGQTFVRDSFIITFLDVNLIEISNITGLQVNDILIGTSYNGDRSIQNYIYVKIDSIPSNDEEGNPYTSLTNREVNVTIYGELETYKYYELIKVGNTSTNFSNLLLDSEKRNIKIVKSVNNINDLFTTLPLPEDEENTIFERPTYPLIDTAIGNLNEVSDSDFTIPNNSEGIYSNNSYLKGQAVLNRLVLGNQLTRQNGSLNIVDLETIKSRTITGSNGLTGGGNIFNNNLVISHSDGTWTNKSTLTGGNVISNLSVDNYGHLTNWTTRVLTTSDISEGSNQYFTQPRVRNTILIGFDNSDNSSIGANDNVLQAFGKTQAQLNSKAENNDSRIINGQSAFSWGNHALAGYITNDTILVDGITTNSTITASNFNINDLNTAPTSSTDTGQVGEIRFTEDYIYVCVGEDQWKRTELLNW